MKRVLLIALLFLFPLMPADDPQTVLLEISSPAGGSEVQDLVQVQGTLEIENEDSSPVAILIATPAWGPPPLDSQFTLRAQGPAIISWALDIGDDGSDEYTGTDDLTTIIRTVDHTFPEGEYPVRLTILADNGKTDDESVWISSGGSSIMMGSGPWALDGANDEFHSWVGLTPDTIIASEALGAAVPNHDVAWGDIRDVTSNSFRLAMGLHDYDPLLFSPIDPVIGAVGYAVNYGVQFCTDHNYNAGDPNGVFCYRVGSVVNALGIQSVAQVSTNDGTGLCDVSDILIETGFDTDLEEFYWIVDRSGLDVSTTGADLNDCGSVVRNGSPPADGTQFSEFGATTSAKAAALVSGTLQLDITDPAPTYILGTVAPPPNLPPSVDLVATPLTGMVPLTVDFTIAVNDPESDPVTWELDVDGDNIADITGLGSSGTHQHTYTEAGNYLAKLTGSDDQGNENFDIASIIATEEGEEPPTGPGGDVGGLLTLREDSCIGDIILTRDLGSSETGRLDFTFPLDVQMLPEGFNRLAFCFTGDGFIPTHVIRDIRVIHSERGPPPAPPAEKAPIRAISLSVPGGSIGESQLATVGFETPGGFVDVSLFDNGAFVGSLSDTFAAGEHYVHIPYLPTQSGTRTISAQFSQDGHVQTLAQLVQIHELPVTPVVLTATATQTSSGWLVDALVRNDGGTGTVNVDIQVGKTIGTTSVWIPAGGQEMVQIQIPALSPGTDIRVLSGASNADLRLKTEFTPVTIPVTEVQEHRVRAIQITLDGQNVAGHVVQDGVPESPLQVEMLIGESSTLLNVDQFGDFTATLPENAENVVFQIGDVSKRISFASETEATPGVPLLVLLGAILYARRR